MTTLSLADLMTPLTTEQVKQSIYNVLAAVGLNTTTWKPGAVVRTMITASSVVLAGQSTLISLIARGGFLETASGPWLTLVARHVFGVEREVATFASGEVTLTNAGGGVYTLDAGDLIVSNPDTGKTFRNTSGFTLNALSSATVPIAAIEAGADSTSVAGAITVLETPLIGVTCTNALALVGRDEESDAVLKQRCEEKLGSLSPNGPWDAYSWVARNAVRSDGTSIGVTRVRTTKDGYGNVNTYVATGTGAVTGTVGDLSTDLGAVDDAIQRKAVPLAVTANTYSATPVTVDITYAVWMYNTSGRTEAEIQTAIETALAAFMATQPIGGNIIGSDDGKVFVSALKAVIGGVFPEIFHVAISSPAADVTLLLTQVPILGTVTGTVTQQHPSAGF